MDLGCSAPSSTASSAWELLEELCRDTAAVCLFLARLWDEGCEECWDGQAGCGQEQEDQGRELEAAAAGAAGLWQPSVLAGAKLRSGHREHQSLILRDLLCSVLGAGLHTVVGFCQSFPQCRITTSVSGHCKTGECFGKQLQWGPGQSCQTHSRSGLGMC